LFSIENEMRSIKINKRTKTENIARIKMKLKCPSILPV